MKYVMMETESGFKYPFIFPELINHVDAAASARSMLLSHRQSSHVVSGGYIGALHPDIVTHGSCTSLDDMRPGEMDAARIVMGQSVAAMPDELIQVYFEKYKRSVKGEERG